MGLARFGWDGYTGLVRASSKRGILLLVRLWSVEQPVFVRGSDVSASTGACKSHHMPTSHSIGERWNRTVTGRGSVRSTGRCPRSGQRSLGMSRPLAMSAYRSRQAPERFGYAGPHSQSGNRPGSRWPTPTLHFPSWGALSFDLYPAVPSARQRPPPVLLATYVRRRPT